MEKCASVRECLLSGKSYDEPRNTLLHLANRMHDFHPKVQVWLIPLGIEASHGEQCLQLLSRDEQVNASRLKFSRHRNRYIAARAMLRVLLGADVGVSPETIAFAYGPHGKPILASHPAVNFNLAHTRELAILAISRTHQVGVDIECINRTLDYDPLARRYFTAHEYANLQLMPAVDRQRAFLTVWTRKEAIAKALGLGLHLPFKLIKTTLTTDKSPRLLKVRGSDARDWSLHTVETGHNCIATVALHRTRAP